MVGLAGTSDAVSLDHFLPLSLESPSLAHAHSLDEVVLVLLSSLDQKS